MKERKLAKLYDLYRKIVMKLFGHKYGCCNNICKNCDQCREIIEFTRDWMK